ncbi:cytochrome c oxidase assembly protein COX20, mitochondrial [Chelonus insularis]|uniref:cytochrome c oxidase assembly protein COX20, mitochondrial n=1 Tax=Chelonus insularis TaxID=460826 RepID=UPI00158C5455|nr:cytochrome c oxidase assembly protein COX20, mitochondrial [Chelonus insularis]
MNPREADLDQSLEEKKVIIFGKDVAKIPCFRTSWLYGITGGIGMGVLTFMFTSRIRLAGHVTMGSICGITLVTFSVCRYQYTKDEYLASQVRSLINESRLLVDVDHEAVIKETQRILNRDD